MPNARSKDQTLLAFTLDHALALALDTASAGRGENRSAFIRRAIVNYLEELGMTLPAGLALAPDRRRPKAAAVPRGVATVATPRVPRLEDLAPVGQDARLNEPSARAERPALPPRKRVNYREALPKKPRKTRA
jgi:hypothetical protein